jgi:hypothetical protein
VVHAPAAASSIKTMLVHGAVSSPGAIVAESERAKNSTKRRARTAPSRARSSPWEDHRGACIDIAIANATRPISIS